MSTDQGQSSHHSAPVDPARVHDPLTRLRTLRNRPDRASAIESELQRQMKSLKKMSRTESAAIDAWNTAAPDELTRSCTPARMHAGRLEVLVPDSSAKFIADRWIRSGGLAELSALARVPIRGVRFVVASDRRSSS